MRIRSLIVIGIIAVFTASLFASTVAFAAQGQITEVNPSGVHGRIAEVNKAGSEIAFTLPPPMQPEGWAPEVGDEVEFTPVCVGGSAHCFATGVSVLDENPVVGLP